MSQPKWEADKMLDVYIYDYLMKRKLHASAKAFQAEGKVSADPVAIDAPGGFLLEWWSVFWDLFIARTNEKHSEAAASYNETQQQQQQQRQKPQQHQQMQMQQLLLQRHAHQQQQQQRQQPRDGNQLPNGNANGLVSSDTLRNPATTDALATEMYEQRKLPLHRDALDDGAVKQRLGDNVGQLLDPNHASMLKAAAAGGQHHGQTLHGAPGCSSGNLQQVQNQSQQLPARMQDIKSEMNSMMNPITARPDGTLIGVQGSNQGSNDLTLKGWPLTLRSGLLQQQKSLMQSPQSLNQIQLQQQLMGVAQQNLASPSASDLECRRLRMLLNNRNVGLVMDGRLDFIGDTVPNIGSSVQIGCPVLPCTDTELLLKLQQQQLQKNNQHKQQSQTSNHHLQQQDKRNSAGSMTTDGGIPIHFQGNDQALKSESGRKRKQSASSSGPANSSGTANTTGPLPSSPSSPSTRTPGDMMSMPSLPHNGGSSKSLLMFDSDGMGSLMSASNQLADIDCFVNDGSLEDNVDSFLSCDDGQCSKVSKGFTITKIRLIPASTSKVECCHFSSDGKLLATGGHDRKAVLWCTESFAMKSTLEEHSQWITDVRFSPSMSRLATCSADKTVRVWNTDNPGYSLRTFTGHSTAVLSLDFHPSKEDLLGSCDNNSEIRYWSIKNGSCAGVFKGGATQMRFQPRLGRFLAAATGNLVTVLDVETQVCVLKLQGHKNLVHSICWDPSGECLASVSDDLVRVWTVGSGNKGECIHELRSTGNKFNTCVFHPTYHSLLVIGCYETLELWNTSENKTISVHAHDKLISALAVSSVTGLVASASHDKCVKLWK